MNLIIKLYFDNEIINCIGLKAVFQLLYKINSLILR